MDHLKKVGLKEADLDLEVSDYDRRTMHAFTPQEGRYARYTEPLRGITSEFQQVKRRLGLEIEYLIALGDEFQNYSGSKRRLIDHPFDDRQRESLRGVYQNFSDLDFVRFKKIESLTDHDVVAMIVLGLYNMGDIVDSQVMERAMHYGRTSSDMDSNVFSLSTQEIISSYYMPLMVELQKMFVQKAYEFHEVPDDYERSFTVLPGQSHEQYAVPTPAKKILANIARHVDEHLSDFIVTSRSDVDKSCVDLPFKLYGKMGGAVGNDEAMCAAYPDHDWENFYKKFIEGLGLIYQPMTDQDEFNTRVSKLLGMIRRVNNPLLKWCDDYSSYLSRKVLRKKTRKESRGSSIMPQKINPWRTEGGEFFLTMANAELGVFDLLEKQRKQGDLRRSALKRYIGIPMANIGIGISRIRDDLKATFPDYEGIDKELAEHPEIAAASVQMILRREGVSDAYDIMADKTKGKTITPEMMNDVVGEMIQENTISTEVGDEIISIFNPENNVGSSLEKADKALKDVSNNLSKLENLYELDL